MFTGSTKGLRFLHARYPVLSTRGLFGAFASAISSAPSYRQSVSEGLNEPAYLTSTHQSSSAQRPSRPILPHHSERPSLPSVAQTRFINKNSTNQVVHAGSPSSTQRELALLESRLFKVVSPTKRKSPAQRRRTLLWILLTAKTLDRAWTAYEALLLHQAVIPPYLLHHLARLLASAKPRTRAVHLQLLSVLKTLQRNHGRLRLWEWNTLIDSSAKQWHKTRMEDYEHALDIFNKRGVLPVGDTVVIDGTVDAAASSRLTPQKPDIWTYNILLSIAARSNQPLAVRHASSLLRASGLTPNRHTHLCLLRYFAVQNDLGNVRSTLHKMKQQGLEVGLDGINACLWAHARNNRFDVALRIYRVLRSNVKPTPDLGEHDVQEDSRYVRDTLGLDMPADVEPDEITYTTMIQTLAYHGDLKHALGVFVDMLSTPNRKAVPHARDATVEPPCFKPSMAAFRALFLGFSRHGRNAAPRTINAEPISAFFPSSQASWGQDALDTVFAAFLQLPSLPKPTDGLFYWILVAFDKTSGSDPVKLRDVWTQLQAKYGGGWGGRLEEIRKTIFDRR